MLSLRMKKACFLINGARPVKSRILRSCGSLCSWKNLKSVCLNAWLYIWMSKKLAEAAVLADEFALTHKNVFLCSESPVPAKNKREWSPNVSRHNPAAVSVNRECFYCHEPGHLIAVCPVLRKKEQSKNKSPVGLIRGELVSNQHEHLTEELLEQEIDDDFQPFISQGFFSSDWQFRWNGCR